MGVLKAVLASGDKEYIDAWLDYVRESAYAADIRFTAFSNEEAFREYMYEQVDREMPDLVIAEPAFLQPWLERAKHDREIPWLMLGEGKEGVQEEKLLAKYQPLPALLDTALNACRQPRRKKQLKAGRGTLLAGVVSASGGCGKTTVAMHLVKQLGVAGYAVLYLNLETLDSTMPFLEKGLLRSHPRYAEAESGLSRLLYDLKAGKKHSGARGEKQNASAKQGGALDDYVFRHDALKADMFWPPNNRKELLQMSCEDAKALMQHAVDCGRYDVIVTDGDSGWDGRSEAVFEAADTLVWLVEDELASMYRWGEWMRHMERIHPERYESVMERARFIANKVQGRMINALPRADLRLDAILPWIPSWKQLSQEEVLLSSPIFQREIRQVCAMLLPDEDDHSRIKGLDPSMAEVRHG